MSTLAVIGLIADVIGIFGAIFALLAWVQARKLREELAAEQKRQEERINVILEHGSQQIMLPGSLRRAELSRAELLGRIGMIPKKDPKARFSLDSLSNESFLEKVNQILDGNGPAVLTISCTEEEFKQFKI